MTTQAVKNAVYEGAKQEIFQSEMSESRTKMETLESRCKQLLEDDKALRKQLKTEQHNSIIANAKYMASLADLKQEKYRLEAKVEELEMQLRITSHSKVETNDANVVTSFEFDHMPKLQQTIETIPLTSTTVKAELKDSSVMTSTDFVNRSMPRQALPEEKKIKLSPLLSKYISDMYDEKQLLEMAAKRAQHKQTEDVSYILDCEYF